MSEFMNEFILVILTSIMNAVFFYLGMSRGTGHRALTQDFPNLNPVKRIEEYKEKKEEQKERERLEVIRQNIDNYDGTTNGQKDIPL